MLALSRFLDRISVGSGVIAALLIFPLIVGTCWEVFARYVLGQPTIWAFEMGYMGMGAHFLLGGAYTLRKRGHIRIDLIYSHMPPKVRASVDLLGHLLLMLPFTLWAAWGLWDFFADAWRFGERSGQSAWNPVIWPFRLVLVTGFVLLALQLVSEIVKALCVLTGQRRSLEETD